MATSMPNPTVGTTGTPTTTVGTTSNPSPTVGAPTGPALNPATSTVSPNFGQYINNMLSMGEGLANLPFQPYTGQRFADTSQLLNNAFGGIGSFNQALGPLKSVQDYMNPYTQNVSDILAREAVRDSEIQRNMDQARFVQAGAYGGSRQAIVDAERSRNLATQIGDIRQKGLAAAWDAAQKQRIDEGNLGIRGLETQGKLGEIQQKLAQDPLDFGYQQWQDSMKWPYQQATFMSSLLQGLPLRAEGYDAGQSPLSALYGGILSALGLEKYLTPGQPTTPTTPASGGGGIGQ